MAAKEGNTNAEKWTTETAAEFIEKVHQYNIENTDNYHLGKAIIESGGYVELWSYLTDKFKEDKIVFQAINKAEQFLEARIINNTVSGEGKSAAMAIFYLKNKHGYKDKSETEHSGSLSFEQIKGMSIE